MKFPRWDHCNQNLRLVLGRRYKERGTTAQRTEPILEILTDYPSVMNQYYHSNHVRIVIVLGRLNYSLSFLKFFNFQISLVEVG